jgi:hypothetical protein
MPKIAVKDAIEAALKFFSEAYDTRPFQDVLLEEVELSEDESKWSVTIGFSRPVPKQEVSIANILRTDYQREYKRIMIDANTGEVRAMKFRTQ